MRPCVGIPDVCPPLCTKAEIDNGTYTLADIEEMNQAIEEALNEAIQARELAMQQAK
ncbi:coil containing protein [Vibrio phage 1.263.B._10N.286.51.B1]|nr:coil containing protein [Vibrio phage 1.263.A._10N.286.51.B1]AUR99280.1 coil containing protein [Vibrio phage 1.263.B._10N.286.51.B1]